MKYIVNPSRIGGSVPIPGSKSHTIRALALGLLAGGESMIRRPLESSDTLSCLGMMERFGARVSREDGAWRVRGTGPGPACPMTSSTREIPARRFT